MTEDTLNEIFNNAETGTRNIINADRLNFHDIEGLVTFAVVDFEARIRNLIQQNNIDERQVEQQIIDRMREFEENLRTQLSV